MTTLVIIDSNSNNKLSNIVFNLESETKPELPAESNINVFKTKSIGENLWYCYCNFKSGQRLTYIKNLFPNSTNISKAPFTLKDVNKYFPDLLIQPSINNSNQLAIPVSQKKLENVVSISGESLPNFEIYARNKNYCFVENMSTGEIYDLLDLLNDWESIGRIVFTNSNQCIYQKDETRDNIINMNNYQLEQIDDDRILDNMLEHNLPRAVADRIYKYKNKMLKKKMNSFERDCEQILKSRMQNSTKIDMNDFWNCKPSLSDEEIDDMNSRFAFIKFT